MIKSFRRQFEQQMIDRARANLGKVGNSLTTKLKDNIATPAPPHSSPGEMPHKMTGELQESIGPEQNGGTLRVKARADHAALLEMGTVKMAPRPFLKRTLVENADELGRIAIKGK